MKVYFVRHGQTKSNALQTYQLEDSELSELGIKQAKILAKRFSKIPIDIIYSSPMKRAKQTAEIISKLTNKKIVYLDILGEGKNPSEFLGKAMNSRLVIEVSKTISLHQKDPIWHYSDEENFADFQRRLKKFFNILSKIKENNILVVAHGGTIKMLIFLMMGHGIDPMFFFRFSDVFTLSNTGITLCEKDKRGGWSVRTYNDHSHLG